MDSTCYAVLSECNSGLWAECTPDDFTFNVKAFRFFTTHQTQPRALPPTVRENLAPSPAAKSNVYYCDLPPELRNRM